MKRTVCVFFVLLGSTTGLYSGTMPSTVYESLNIRVTTPFDLGRAYGEQFVETLPLSTLPREDGNFITYDGKLADSAADPFDIFLPAIFLPPGATVLYPPELILFISEYSRTTTRYEWKPVQESCSGLPCTARPAIFTLLYDTFAYEFPQGTLRPYEQDSYFTVDFPRALTNEYFLSGQPVLLTGMLRHMLDGDSDVSFSRPGYNSYTKAVNDGDIAGSLTA